MANVVQTQASKFTSLGLLTINVLDESSVLGTPTTRIQRPTDGYYWSIPDHVFGEAKEVVMSAATSEHDYNYKI